MSTLGTGGGDVGGGRPGVPSPDETFGGVSFEDLLLSQHIDMPVVNMDSIVPSEEVVDDVLDDTNSEDMRDIEVQNVSVENNTSEFRNVYINVAEPAKGRDFGLADPFDLVKHMTEYIGKYKTCRPLKSGSLLVEVDTPEQVQKLLALDKFMGIKVVVKIAADIGTLKGTIFDQRIVNKTAEELCENWKQYGVVHVEKNTYKDKEGRAIYSGRYVLTFKGDSIPEKVYVGNQVKYVRPWVRSVLQCKKCNKFNHFAKNCRGYETCHKCSLKHPHTEDCDTAILKCSNCGKIGHGARNKKCRFYIRELDICNIRNTHKVGFRAASDIREKQIKNKQVENTPIQGGAARGMSGSAPSNGRNLSVGDSWRVDDGKRKDAKSFHNRGGTGPGKFVIRQATGPKPPTAVEGVRTGGASTNRETPSFNFHSSQTAAASHYKHLDFTQLFKNVEPRSDYTALVGTDRDSNNVGNGLRNRFQALQEEDLGSEEVYNGYVRDNDSHKKRKLIKDQNNNNFVADSRNNNHFYVDSRIDNRLLGNNANRCKDKYTVQQVFKTREVGIQADEVYDKIIIPRKYKDVHNSIDEQKSPIVRNTREVNDKLVELLPQLGRFVENDTQLAEIVHLLVEIIRIVSHREMNQNFIRDGITKK